MSSSGTSCCSLIAGKEDGSAMVVFLEIRVCADSMKFLRFAALRIILFRFLPVSTERMRGGRYLGLFSGSRELGLCSMACCCREDDECLRMVVGMTEADIRVGRVASPSYNCFDDIFILFSL